MLKKLLSFLLANLAILAVSITLFAWIIDSTIMKPEVLLPALRKSGTQAAIAKAIPTIVDSNVPPNEAAQIKTTLGAIITEQYVDEKLTVIVTAATSYIKTGEPEPALDFRDVPAKISAAGVPVPPELNEKLAQPIKLTDPATTKTLADMRQWYEYLQMVKILGGIVAGLLIVLVWFLADRGAKTTRLASVFGLLTFWSGLYWLVLTKAPGLLEQQLVGKGGAEGEAASAVGTSLLHGIGGLFAHYMMLFAIGCGVLTAIFVILHFVLKAFNHPLAAAPPAAKPLPKAVPKYVPKTTPSPTPKANTTNTIKNRAHR